VPRAIARRLYFQNRIVAEEADEAVYWLDVTAGATITKAAALQKLQQEAN
jgi:hypothetical protein